MWIYGSICSNRLTHSLDREEKETEGDMAREREGSRDGGKHRLTDRQRGLLESASFR